MAFSDDLIRARPDRAARDSAAEPHLASVLIKRRDAIGGAYLTAINLIVGRGWTLNAGSRTPPRRPVSRRRRLSAAWSLRQRDRDHHPVRRKPRRDGAMARRAGCPMRWTRSSRPTSPRAAEPAGRTGATFFRRTRDGWKLVGLERLPETTARLNGEAR
jgi:hypothetical protein